MLDNPAISPPVYAAGTGYKIEVAIKSGTRAFGGFGSPFEVSSPVVAPLANCCGIVAKGLRRLLKQFRQRL